MALGHEKYAIELLKDEVENGDNVYFIANSCDKQGTRAR
jgi:hypothetical protein